MMMLSKIAKMFPILALVFAVLSYLVPAPFMKITPYISYLLMLIMFFMGITLSLDNFANVFKNPIPVIIGTVTQYTVMPFAAFSIAYILNMPAEIAAGMILVGTVAGGTASNVMTYIAKGDVALSVTLSAISTLLGVIITPFLTKLYVDAAIEVNAWAMLRSIFDIVFAPIAFGLVVNYFFYKRIKKIEPVLPLLSMGCMLCILSAVVGNSQPQIASVGIIIIIAVILHNTIGLVSGYWLGKLFRLDERTCRTLSIEIGMQNSGLAVALSKLYFTPIAALPGALFSVWHSISGSLVAGYWGARVDPELPDESAFVTDKT